MTTNRTSQAVEQMVLWSDKLKHLMPDNEEHDAILAIAEKYTRMEDALAKIQHVNNNAVSLHPDDRHIRIQNAADDALSFDPLSEQS